MADALPETTWKPLQRPPCYEVKSDERRVAQRCAVGMSANIIASWQPVRRQDSAVLQMIIPSSQPKLAYGTAGQLSFDWIPLPVVQSLHSLALALNTEVLEASLSDSKGHFLVNPFRQSTHLQILQDVLCGALLQPGADAGEVGNSDRSFIADMPTAHVCATQRFHWAYISKKSSTSPSSCPTTSISSPRGDTSQNHS
jgi:hypothetical protein